MNLSKYLLILLFPFISICSIQGQNAKIRAANEFFVKGFFAEAIDSYEEGLKKGKIKKEEKNLIYKNLAKSYQNIHNYEKAQKYYDKYFSKATINEDEYLDYASILLTNGEVNRAKEYYIKYAEVKDDPRLKKQYTRLFAWVEKHDAESPLFLINETNINTGGSSMGFAKWKNDAIIGKPTSSSEGKKTVFYNLALAKMTDSVTFNEPEIFAKGISKKFFEGFPSFTKDGNTMYFTANTSDEKYLKKKDKKSKDYSNAGINVLNIYSSEYENGKWSEPESMKFNTFENNFTHPAISEDGKTLYFVSDIKGGQGGYDIYITTKEDTGWTKPKNLGRRVNTSQDEMTPYYANNTLYFSSRGHFGFGGSDILRVTSSKRGTFGYPRNLGKPINSPYDDFAYSVDSKGENGYLSSNRGTKHGEDKIYHIKILPQQNTIINAYTKKPVRNTDVELYLQDDDGKWKKSEVVKSPESIWTYRFDPDKNYKVRFNNPYYQYKTYKLDHNLKKRKAILKRFREVRLKPLYIKGKVVDGITDEAKAGAVVILYEKGSDGEWVESARQTTKKNGKWSFPINRLDTYKVEVKANGFKPYASVIPSIASKNKDRKKLLTDLYPLKLQMEAKKDNKLKINNLYFDYDKASLQEVSYQILDNIYKYLQQNPDVRIELSAHTDCVGSQGYNQSLSQRRAQTCYKYLINKGISKSRIVPKGYGKKFMLNSCKEQKIDPDKAAINRRVEIKIL